MRHDTQRSAQTSRGPGNSSLPFPSSLDSLDSFDSTLYWYLHNSPYTYHYTLPLSPPISSQIISAVSTRFCGGTEEGILAVYGTKTVPLPSLENESETATADGVEYAAEDGGERQEHALKTGRMEKEDVEEPNLPPEYQKSQRGKACGHVFRKGEGVYRCRNCALDETCVFCSRCFYATNHDGHDTTFAIAAGSGGCCDCGDPEAWKVPIQCKYHAPAPKEEQTTESKLNASAVKPTPLPEGLVYCMRSTIATVLDFVIDTFADSPSDFAVPTTVDEVLSANPPESHEEAQRISDGRSAPFACVLWNDEVHSFQEVIDQVVEAVHCSTAFAKSVAERVDAHGRDVISLNTSIEDLVRAARTISNIGLAVSIRSARETFRESIAGVLVDWLKNLPRKVSGSRRMGDTVYESVEGVARRLICEELCKERQKVKRVLVGRNAEAHEEDIVDLLDGRLAETVFPMSKEFIRVADAAATMVNDRRRTSIPEKKLRIDHLLAYDMKLWKEARNSLRELYIGTLIVSADEYKKIMGIQFAYNYLHIAKSYLFHDREFELSIINFSVQLFTVPTIAQHLVAHTTLVPTLFTILKAFYLSDVSPTTYDLNKFYDAFRRALGDVRSHYPKLTCESEAARNRRYWHVFQDLRYVLSAHKVRDEEFRRHPTDLYRFLDLCRVWQGMHPQQRYTRTHVEYETENWVRAFNLSLQVGRLVKLVSDCFGPTANADGDILALKRAIRATVYVIDRWCGEEQAEEVRHIRTQLGLAAGVGVDPNRRMPAADGLHLVEIGNKVRLRVPFFRVASQPVSFHQPLHWFLAYLLTHVPRVLREVGDRDLRARIWSQLFAFDDQKVERRYGIPVDDIPMPDGTVLVTASPHADLSTGPPSREDRVSRLLDYPLRAAVLLSQIRAAIWVRNGYNIRTQALHYREATLRESYDQDLFLLQTSAILIGSDRFMTILLDRFDLVEWFQGRTREAAARTNFESNQLTNLAEDLLQLIIVVLTERAKAAAVSVESEIRREIIHHLAVHPSGLAYSELTKRIPERLVESEGDGKGFDAILGDLAVFKFPDGMSDHGLYELKDEYYDEVDPWFWHYTRNQRVDVEEVLKKRAEAKRGQLKTGKKRGVDGNLSGKSRDDEDVRPPKILPIPEGTGYDELKNVVRGEVFVRILFFALWNMAKEAGEGGEGPVRSDTLLAETVHLMLVALEVETAGQLQPQTQSDTNSFLHFAAKLDIETAPRVGSEAKRMTLLELVLGIVDRANEEEFKEHAARLRYFVRRFEEVGGERARTVIAGWRDKSRWGGLSSPEEAARAAAASASEELSEQERKKLASKARQAAIMAQFAQAQKSFMANYGEDMEDIDGDDEEMEDEMEGDNEGAGRTEGQDERFWEFPTGTCIVCQEETSKGGQLYGLLGFIQPSCVLRHVDFSDPMALAATLSNPPSLDVEQIRANASNVTPTQDNATSPAQLATSPSSWSIMSGPSPPSTPIFSSPVHPQPTPGLALGRPISTHLSSPGLYTSTCGHLMHFTCFQSYFASLEARQAAQPTRNHPENIERKEFMCPLCKSLGNCILPVLWSGRVENVNWAGSNRPQSQGTVTEAASVDEWWETRAKGFVDGVLRKRQQGQWARADEDEDMANQDDLDADNALEDFEGTSDPAERRGSTSRKPSGTAQRFRKTMANFLSDILHRGRGSAQQISEISPLLGAGFGASPPPASMDEIRRIYTQRLINIVRMVNRNVNPEYDAEEAGLKTLDLLWGLLCYTISGVEVTTRGIGGNAASGAVSGGGSGLARIGVLDALTAQSLILLRVLSETVLTYTSFVVHTSQTETKLRQRGADMLGTLFVGFDEEGELARAERENTEDEDEDDEAQMTPALMQDSFCAFVEVAMAIVPTTDLGTVDDVFQWARVFYVLELVHCLVAVAEAVGVLNERWIMDSRLSAVAKEALARSRKGQSSDRKGKGPAHVSTDVPMTDTNEETERKNVLDLFRMIVRHLGMRDAAAQTLESIDPAVLLALCRSVVLPFLRKSVILLHARFGIVPPGGQAGFGYDRAANQDGDNVDEEADECDRLTAYLRLPPVSSWCTQTMQSPFFVNLVSGWCVQLSRFDRRHFKGDESGKGRNDAKGTSEHGGNASAPIAVSQSRRASNKSNSALQQILDEYDDDENDRLVTINVPTIFELVALPRRLDALFEESLKRVCHKCGTVPSDPALCLLCGTFVCSQSFCCAEDERGECNIHARACGGDIGIYLLIKKCVVLLLHNDNGYFMNPPYLDAHGEVDVGLRRGRPQYLNMRRYDEIRRLWLTHGIPSCVARKIEQSFDFGGWATL